MLEIIATTVEDAVLIERGGAGRIELISALAEGGLTPSYGLMRQVIQTVSIPVNVMIRPHSQGYTYSEADIRCMIEDIKQAKSLGANGVVLGALDREGRIDRGRLNQLLNHCGGLAVTFHRAMDEAANIIAATRLVASAPIHRVLSSGGPGKAEANLPVLRNMQAILAEKGKQLLVGSGVHKGNCQAILRATRARELHVGTGVRQGASPRGPINLQAVRETVSACKKAREQLGCS